MKESRIEAARRDALRFVDAATELMKQKDKDWLIVGSALSGKVRRVSMDLTRSLAEMRKP